MAGHSESGYGIIEQLRQTEIIGWVGTPSLAGCSEGDVADGDELTGSLLNGEWYKVTNTVLSLTPNLNHTIIHTVSYPNDSTAMSCLVVVLVKGNLSPCWGWGQGQCVVWLLWRSREICLLVRNGVIAFVWRG